MKIKEYLVVTGNFIQSLSLPNNIPSNKFRAGCKGKQTHTRYIKVSLFKQWYGV